MNMDNFNLAHPSILLPAYSVETIRDAASTADEKGCLQPAQLEIIRTGKWFQLFVPEEQGGLGLSLPEAIRLLEALAWLDGSLGWTVTLCGGANWFIGFFDESLKKQFFSGTDTCLAGSGAPTGTAVARGEGYIINGSWRFVTGAPFATAFTANCILEGDTGEVGTFIFTPDEVAIKEDWFAVGMRATASYSMEVNNLYVPRIRRFELSDGKPVIRSPLYSIPFEPYAEITLAANFSGLIQRFMDIVKQLMDDKIKQRGYNVDQASELLEVMGRLNVKYQHLRNKFLENIEEGWQYANEHFEWDASQLKEMSAAAHALAKEAVEYSDKLYPYCGMVAADTRTELNRVWRDLHTASQHVLFMFN